MADLEVPAGTSATRLDARRQLLGQLDQLQRRTESQPASTVFFRSLRARRARTRTTARVTCAAWAASPIRRSAEE